MKQILHTLLFILLLPYGCNNNYTPKPRGYFRIDFPEKKYQLLNTDCPFSFEYPIYGKAVKDSDKNAEPCWLNLEFPQYKSKIHLSYKSVKKNVAVFIEDSHTLAFKHSIKADAIEPTTIIDQKRNVYGLIFDIKGNAASSVQFYLTDSIRHFLRGSLYFENQPNKDSLAPAIEFFRKDIVHLIETLKWKENSH
jgi:gliding motility-associated lipoprotein GldD